MAYNFQTWFPLTIHTIEVVSQFHNFTAFNQQSAIHHPPSQPLLWLLHHFSALPGTSSNVSTSHPFTLSLNHLEKTAWQEEISCHACHLFIPAWRLLGLNGTPTNLPPVFGGSLEVESQEAAGIVESCCSRWWWVLDVASFLCWSSPTSVWPHSCCVLTTSVLVIFWRKTCCPLNPKKNIFRRIRSFHQRRRCNGQRVFVTFRAADWPPQIAAGPA